MEKEILVFALVYNLVQSARAGAAAVQGVPRERISFVDALRQLRWPLVATAPPELWVNPQRPDRYEPRVRKRRPLEYPLMKHAWNDSPYGTSNLKYYKLNFQISGPSVLCNSPEAYNLTNTPGGAITWTNSNNTSRVSNQGSNPCNFSSVSNGSGWIKASFTSGCGTSFTLDQKNIWVGGPETPVIDGSTYITCDNELFTEDNRKTVTWSVYGPMQIVGQTYGYRCTIEGTGNGYGWVYATAANGCDTITSELFVEVDCGYLLVFTPNPATGETILSIESTSEKKIVDETIDWELEVYDQAQNLKLKNPKAQGKEYRFNTSGWKEGIYVARVKYDDKILTGKLVVKK